jgi:hypothetical protein
VYYTVHGFQCKNNEECLRKEDGNKINDVAPYVCKVDKDGFSILEDKSDEKSEKTNPITILCPKKEEQEDDNCKEGIYLSLQDNCVIANFFFLETWGGILNFSNFLGIWRSRC